MRLQVLLEEMADSPGIVFVAVTMPDGTIVAHSNPARLGEILQVGGREADDIIMHDLAPDMLPHWGIMRMEGGACLQYTGSFRRACATCHGAFPASDFSWP